MHNCNIQIFFLFIQTENCSHTTDLQSKLEYREVLLPGGHYFGLALWLWLPGSSWNQNQYQGCMPSFNIASFAAIPLEQSTTHCSTTQSNKTACSEEYFQIYNMIVKNIQQCDNFLPRNIICREENDNGNHGHPAMNCIAVCFTLATYTGKDPCPCNVQHLYHYSASSTSFLNQTEHSSITQICFHLLPWL